MNLDCIVSDDMAEVVLSGDFIGYDDEGLKNAVYRRLSEAKIRKIKFSGALLRKWDSSLVVILYRIAQDAGVRKQELVYDRIPDNLQKLVRLALSVDRQPEKGVVRPRSFLENVGAWGIEIWRGIKKGLDFIGHTMSSVMRLLTSSAVMRRVDFLFALEDSSYKAVGIVSLVSFMVGLILAFVGAIQLKTFGAQIYVASLVAIGMTRIMGAIMVGIIMAGRTGASYAAAIGTMQVNEELDALQTMGISRFDFLVLPRIIALTITMPSLTMLADGMGIAGGAFVGITLLGISPEEYWKYSYDALDMTNFLVGIFHGFVYGWIIAVCGCYYGINAGRNADSVGLATTKAVVTGIVWMIVVTGILTMIFEVLGI